MQKNSYPGFHLLEISGGFFGRPPNDGIFWHIGKYLLESFEHLSHSADVFENLQFCLTIRIQQSTIAGKMNLAADLWNWLELYLKRKTFNEVSEDIQTKNDWGHDWNNRHCAAGIHLRNQWQIWSYRKRNLETWGSKTKPLTVQTTSKYSAVFLNKWLPKRNCSNKQTISHTHWTRLTPFLLNLEGEMLGSLPDEKKLI